MKVYQFYQIKKDGQIEYDAIQICRKNATEINSKEKTFFS